MLKRKKVLCRHGKRSTPYPILSMMETEDAFIVQLRSRNKKRMGRSKSNQPVNMRISKDELAKGISIQNFTALATTSGLPGESGNQVPPWPRPPIKILGLAREIILCMAKASSNR